MYSQEFKQHFVCKQRKTYPSSVMPSGEINKMYVNI